MKRAVLLAGLLLILAACNGSGGTTAPEPEPEPAQTEDAGLQQLVQWMSGSFSSEQQSVDDERFFHIQLHVARVWPEREDAFWLYVEQAAASAPESPYRQRIYRLTRLSDEVMESRIFELADPENYVGAWQDPTRFEGATPDSLTYRTGCEVLLKFAGDRVVGGTLGNLCKSALRGASYATTRVDIGATGMVSWDQGFDAEDTQVWGSEVGGYRFLRVE